MCKCEICQRMIEREKADFLEGDMYICHQCQDAQIKHMANNQEHPANNRGDDEKA